MFSYFVLFLSIIVSISIVYSGHICWNYIVDNYSQKKTKDLVNTQILKYKKMMKELENNQKTAPSENFLNDHEKTSMDQRLTDFMNQI